MPRNEIDETLTVLRRQQEARREALMRMAVRWFAGIGLGLFALVALQLTGFGL